MLQPIDKLQTADPRFDGGAGAQDFARQERPQELLSEAIAFARRQYALILFVTAIFVAIAIAYVATAQRLYTAQATMIIDPRTVQMFQPTPSAGPAVFDTAAIESQIEVLRSQNIAERVVRTQGLTSIPEFVGGDPGLLGTLRLYARRMLGRVDLPDSNAVDRRAIAAFHERLRVARVGLTHVIAVSFRSASPDLAAQIANATVEAYIVDQLEARFDSTKRAGSWLEERLDELSRLVATSEQAVIDFKTQNNIVEVKGEAIDDQQIKEINSQLVVARAQTAEAVAKLERIQQIIQSGNPDSTVTEALTNPVITGLRTRLVEAISRETLWSARYGGEHLAVVSLRGEIRELRRTLLEELKRIAATYESEYEISKAREEAIKSALSDSASRAQITGQAQIALRELEAAVKTYRMLYDTFKQRHTEALQQESFPISDTRLITNAARPLSPSHPQVALVMALALFGGLAGGVGVAFVRELMDRVVRTTQQIERLSGVDCLAILPLLKEGQEKRRRRRTSAGGTKAGEATPRKIAPQSGVLDHVVAEPFSRYTEAMRSIKVSIDLAASERKPNVVGITSTLPNEGKTSIAINLARLIAQTGKRTILVDCDLRNPSASHALAPSARTGVVEIALGSSTTVDTIWTDSATQLDFLPVVLKRRLSQTSELLTSPAIVDMFAHLRTMYDYVIVDLPPLAPIVDTRTAINLVDSFVYVVEWGNTRVDVISHALNRARPVQERLLGMVLNKVNMAAFSRFEHYRSDYYVNKYYSRYGYTD